MQFTRLGFPKGCIEMDLSKNALDHILIKNDKNEIIKQKIFYENRSRFCIRCRNLGHFVRECRLAPNSRAQIDFALDCQERIASQDIIRTCPLTRRNSRVEPTKI